MQSDYSLKNKWVFWETYAGAGTDNFLDFNKPIVDFENLVEFEKIWNYPNEKLKKPSSLFVDAIN